MTIYGVHWKDTIDYDEGLIRLFFDKNEAKRFAKKLDDEDETGSTYHFVRDHKVF